MIESIATILHHMHDPLNTLHHERQGNRSLHSSVTSQPKTNQSLHSLNDQIWVWFTAWQFSFSEIAINSEYSPMLAGICLN